MAKSLQNLIDEYNDKAHDSTPAQIAKMTAAINEARAKEQAALVDGAKPCKGCGQLPHVIKQPRSAGSIIFHYYEVGCLTNHDKPRRTMNQEREAAIAEWNRLFA